MNHNLRVQRRLIGRRDAREFRELSRSGFLIKTLNVPTFTHIEWRIAVDFNEIALPQKLSYTIAIAAERGYEGRNDDQAGIGHELAHLTNSTNVLASILGGETKIAAQAMSHIIAIEHVGVTALGNEPFLNTMREGGFSGARKPGQPDNATVMAIKLFALGAGHDAVLPSNVMVLSHNQSN